MAKEKMVKVISTAVLIEMVEGKPVNRAPGTPVSVPEGEAADLVARKLAVYAPAETKAAAPASPPPPPPPPDPPPPS